MKENNSWKCITSGWVVRRKETGKTATRVFIYRVTSPADCTSFTKSFLPEENLRINLV